MPNLNTIDELESWESTCNIEAYAESKMSIKNIEHIPPQPAILQSSTIHDDYILNNYTMKFLFDQEQIVFYELLPNDDRDTYNAAFVLPGTGHQGARDILGIPSEYSQRYYHDEIGKRIVEEGLAVYVIELRGVGTRQVNVDKLCPELNDRCSSNILENRLSAIGISLSYLQEAEITQLLTWIESREYIDKIGTVGLSKGAGLAVTQAILHPDLIDAVVMASGVTHLEDSPLNRSHGGSGISEISGICYILTNVGTIAPIPAYMSYGLQESEAFRYEAEVGDVKKYMSQVYDIHDASEDFTYVVHDGKHQYDIPTVLEFLKKHLNTSD
jgi:dienelactone hydrolase